MSRHVVSSIAVQEDQWVRISALSRSRAQDASWPRCWRGVPAAAPAHPPPARRRPAATTSSASMTCCPGRWPPTGSRHAFERLILNEYLVTELHADQRYEIGTTARQAHGRARRPAVYPVGARDRVQVRRAGTRDRRRRERRARLGARQPPAVGHTRSCQPPAAVRGRSSTWRAASTATSTFR